MKTTDALLELLCQKPPITWADVAVQVGRTVRADEMAKLTRHDDARASRP
ncbi:MAG: hypothetical protein ACYCYH_14565 [Steroidobacteraceae bacterium]